MTYHMAIDVRGALVNFVDREWIGCCTDDDGHTMSPREVKIHLAHHLQLGHRVIPTNPSACDNFDYQKGCMGHDDKKAMGASA